MDPIDFSKPVRVAGVYEDKEIRLYVNGKLQNRADAHDRTGDLDILRLGPQLGDVFFQGVLDEVRVSNSARYQLSYQPIERFVDDAETIALYHFDEGEGNWIRDSSRNARHLQFLSQRWVLADSLGTDDFTLERDAAETILRGGGSLVIYLVDGTEPHHVDSLDELPRGKWRIFAVTLGPDTKVEDLEKLKTLPYLGTIGTGQCPIRAREVLAQISGMDQMGFLGMNGAGLTSDDLQVILKFPRLSTLQAYMSNWRDEDIVQLVQLKTLQDLNVGGTQISDAALLELARLPKLASLWLSGTDVSNEGLMHLANCKTLRSIYVGKTRVTEDGVAAFRKLRPDCTVQIQEAKPDTTQRRD